MFILFHVFLSSTEALASEDASGRQLTKFVAVRCFSLHTSWCISPEFCLFLKMLFAGTDGMGRSGHCCLGCTTSGCLQSWFAKLSACVSFVDHVQVLICICYVQHDWCMISLYTDCASKVHKRQFNSNPASNYIAHVRYYQGATYDNSCTINAHLHVQQNWVNGTSQKACITS